MIIIRIEIHFAKQFQYAFLFQMSDILGQRLRHGRLFRPMSTQLDRLPDQAVIKFKICSHSSPPHIVSHNFLCAVNPSNRLTT